MGNFQIHSLRFAKNTNYSCVLKNYTYLPVTIFYLTELIENVKFLIVHLYNNKII